MRAGWAEGPQAEPDEGPTFQCWAEPGSQPLTTCPLLVLSPYEQYQANSKGALLLLPTTARLATHAGHGSWLLALA